MSPEFLAIEDVLDIHALQLARYGGPDGLRDQGLLESALAQPQATFGGGFVHDGLFPMAAAYLFHIVSNHPFIDGNKRTSTASPSNASREFSMTLRCQSLKVLPTSEKLRQRLRA